MNTSPLLAYHSDPKLKRAMLREVRKHQNADQIVAGTYGKRNGKWVGCAVGCSIHSLALIQGRTLDTSNHMLFESEAGVPVMLARLQDVLFEGMPQSERTKFPLRFWTAIKPGADLSTVGWKFLHWLLTRSGIGAYNDPIVSDAVAQCAAALEPLMRGEPVNASAARSAESAAWSAAWSAARSAESAARSAAWSAESAASAAWSAESAESAESAAWSAASAESAASAASAAYKTMADQLIALMEAA